MSILQTKDYKNFTIDGLSVPFNSVTRCLPNDEVTPNGGTQTSWTFTKRAKHPPLVGTLDCLNKTRYGFTSRNVPIYLFNPMDRAYPPFRVGSTVEPDRNYLVVVDFDTWEIGQTFPRANMRLVLGSVGDFEAEAEALFWRYSPWSALTKKQAEILRPAAAVATEKGRIDITHLDTFNVDPDSCRDIDDVFSYQVYHDGSTECFISIADVAALISVGSELDKHAASIGQTLYQDGRKPRHMLPSQISEEAGSLIAGEKRMAISARYIMDVDGTVDFKGFVETILMNKSTYSYDTIYGSIHSHVLSSFAKALNPNVNSDSHEWIASLMIDYNKRFASTLREKGAGLLRAHTAPDVERLTHYEALDPSLRFLAFSSAKYTASTSEQTHHYGLGAEVYTHATSPLRRYADIINQRVLKGLIAEDYATIAIHLNAAAKAAKTHDRDFLWLSALRQPERELNGLVLEKREWCRACTEEKAPLHVIWISAWQRTIKIRSLPDLAYDPLVGEHVKIKFWYNLGRPNWKERIVFQLLEPEIK